MEGRHQSTARWFPLSPLLCCQDIPHIQALLDAFDGDVTMELVQGSGLIALQGPKAVQVIAQN